MTRTTRVFSLIVSSAIGFGALTWNAATHLRATAESDYRSYGVAIARAIAVGASEQLTSLAGNPADSEMRSEIATLQGYIDYNKDLPGICYIFIEESDGTVLHSFAGELPHVLEKANPTKADDDEVRIAPEVRVPDAPCGSRHDPGMHVLDVAAPISGGTLGAVHVGMDRDEIEMRAAGLSHSMIAISLAALLLVGAVSIWVLRSPG